MDTGFLAINIELAMRHKHKDMSIVQELQVFMQIFHPCQDAGGIAKGKDQARWMNWALDSRSLIAQPRPSSGNISARMMSTSG